MWGFKRNRVNTQTQSNKAKAGSIKNSTIEVNGGSNDVTLSVLLQEVLNVKDDLSKATINFNQRVDKIEKRQLKNYKKINENAVQTKRLSSGFKLYQNNNGIPAPIKIQVTEILDGKRKPL